MYAVRSPPQQLQELRMYVNGSRGYAPSPVAGYRPRKSNDVKPSGYINALVKVLSKRNQTAAIGAMLASIKNHIAAGGSSDFSSSLSANVGRRPNAAAERSRMVQPYNFAIGSIAGLFLLLTCGVTVATLRNLRRKRNVISTERSLTTAYLSRIDSSMEQWELEELSTPSLILQNATGSGLDNSPLSTRDMSLECDDESVNTLSVDIDDQLTDETCKSLGSLTCRNAASPISYEDRVQHRQPMLGSTVELLTMCDSSIDHV